MPKLIAPNSIIVVSGRSGSGKTSVLSTLEDFGYYPLDNLPLSIVPLAIEKLVNDSQIHRIAVGIDVRTPKADLSNFGQVYDSLIQTYGKTALTVLYTTAQDDVLVARYDATRRVHPLMAMAGNLPNAIQKETALLEPIACHADIKIDTSLLNIHELKNSLRQHLGVDNHIIVNVLSFGFRHGTPKDADFVFDVRTLPNPHWQMDLRPLTGLDVPVQEFFAQFPAVYEMTHDISTFLLKWLPDFIDNNRHFVTIAIGCTGGKHRSVFVSQAVGEILTGHLPDKMQVTVKHREKSFW